MPSILIQNIAIVNYEKLHRHEYTAANSILGIVFGFRVKSDVFHVIADDP